MALWKSNGTHTYREEDGQWILLEGSCKQLLEHIDNLRAIYCGEFVYFVKEEDNNW